MATSATDLILPVGLLLYTILNPLALFFIFLWRGATGKYKISFASILGLVLAVIIFALGITQQPIMWIYDNQTITYVNAYLVPQGQGVDLYGILLVYQSFLVIVAVLKLMLETDLLGGESVG